MASVVGIVNSALIKVGSKKMVISLDDGSPGANFGAARYAEVRDELLRGHPWNFAVHRVKLARLSTIPNHEWAYEYTLPTGWLRTLWVAGNEDGSGYPDYREEGGKIVSDFDELWMKFVYQEADPNIMTPDFRELVALKLAAEAAIHITNSTTLADGLDDKFGKAWIKATSVDSLGDRPGRMGVGSWTTSRFGTTRNIRT